MIGASTMNAKKLSPAENLQLIVNEINSTFKTMIRAQSTAAHQAKSNKAINEALSDSRESFYTGIKRLYTFSDSDAIFLPLIGDILLGYFKGTTGKDKTRAAWRAAVKKGIELRPGFFLETDDMPKKWDSSSLVKARIVQRIDPTAFEGILTKLGGLSDGELNSLVVQARTLVDDRKDAATATEAARQMLADALATTPLKKAA
jgi:hypothetical protein